MAIFNIEYPTFNTYSIAYDTPINNSSIVHIVSTQSDQVTTGDRSTLEDFSVPAPDTPSQQDTTKNALKARINVLFGERSDLNELLNEVDNL